MFDKMCDDLKMFDKMCDDLKMFDKMCDDLKMFDKMCDDLKMFDKMCDDLEVFDVMRGVMSYRYMSYLDDLKVVLGDAREVAQTFFPDSAFGNHMVRTAGRK
jgi:hypothetical protein